MKNELIKKDGEYYRKVMVVMLPTKDRKAQLRRYVDGCIYGTQRIVNPLAEVDFQHLYFLSDEEIKEGDWVIHESHGIKRVLRCEEIVGKSIVTEKGKSSCWIDYCKKIIASTDQSLLISKSTFYKTEDYDDTDTYIPRPSNEFLQAYCKADGKIDEVLVEVNYGTGVFKGVTGSLKISPDNTITIKPI